MARLSDDENNKAEIKAGSENCFDFHADIERRVVLGVGGDLNLDGSESVDIEGIRGVVVVDGRVGEQAFI